MEYKTLFGALSIIIQITSYLVYFRGIYKGKTKPHAFTWLIWSILNVIGFFAALTSSGYAVAFILAINALGCLITSVIGFYQRKVSYDIYDILSLVGALVGIILWNITSNPIYAVVLISISDFVGIIPTLRKAYILPQEENLESFIIGIFYYILALSALASYQMTNWLYPASIVFSDLSLIFIILIRRKKLKVISSH